MKQEKELIQLQSAHITQYDTSVKSDWVVEENITNKVIQRFPGNISDNLMFTILNFARKYELKAFNAGIKFQKTKQNELLHEKVTQMQKIIDNFATENERLSYIIEIQTREP